MLNLFKPKSEKEKLEKKYKDLLSKAHKLSHSDRKASDQKMFEADEVLKRIEAL
ncbi:MAG: Lacal_2735 family protein [Cyclobacteriaceae bacterium]|nr:Lacal_2735 family protein [Cyclobacteriaceae bacterium HetDA_MAG_MS6]